MLVKQIKELYKTSKIAKLFSWLFLNDFEIRLNETVLGKLLEKLYLPYVSEVCLGVGLFLILYNGFLQSIHINLAWLFPWLLILSLLYVDKSKIKLRKVHVYYLIFLLVSLISGLYSYAFLNVSAKLLILGWLIFVQFGLALMIGGLFKEKLFDLLIFATAPLSLVGLSQIFLKVTTPRKWLSPNEELTKRVFAFFGSPNVFGLILAIISLIAFAKFLKTKKYYYLVFSILDAVVMVFTFSRSAWFGFLAGLVLLLLFYKKELILFSPFALLLLFVEKIRQRIFIVFSADYLFDASLDGRIWSYINGFFLLRKYPLLGTGPGSYGGQIAINYASPIYLIGIQNGYTALYYTDNQWLEILIQTGLVGFISFLLFVVGTIASLISTYLRKKDIMAIAGLAVMVCFLIAGAFENVIEFGAAAVPVGLILGNIING